MKRIYLGAFVFLYGCQTQPTLTHNVAPVEVPVVIEKTCIDEKSIPPIPPTSAIADGNQTQQTAAMSVDARQYKRTAERMEALLKQCVIQTK